VCSCAPIVGALCGGFAVRAANAQIDRLPSSRKYD
jgi:hypothetical protein